jgi:hypothetical protein
VPAEEDAGGEASVWELRERCEREVERRVEAEELGADSRKQPPFFSPVQELQHYANLGTVLLIIRHAAISSPSSTCRHRHHTITAIRTPPHSNRHSIAAIHLPPCTRHHQLAVLLSILRVVVLHVAIRRAAIVLVTSYCTPSDCF